MFNKRAFKDRVDLERKVLRLVNSSRISPLELTGLSTPALDKWTETIFSQPELKHVATGIKSLMLEISERLRLNSDKSRDVFENDELVPKNTIEVCLIQLEKALTSANFNLN